MSKLDDERAELAKADLGITQGQDRIARQAQLIERIKDDREGSVTARDLLATLKATLDAWRSHRVEILRRIDYLEHEQQIQLKADRAL